MRALRQTPRLTPVAESPSTGAARRVALWLVLLAAAGTFGLTMGTRQTMGLFLGPLNTSTGLGLAQISLAFAFGQLFWGLTQPFAGMFADRIGAGRVLFIGVAMVALGIFITPWMGSTGGLVLSIGVLAAGGAGMAGPAVLMAATNRLVAADRRGLATGIVNAGGSLGQFLMAPLAGALLVGVGWANAMQVLGLCVLLALPAAFLLKGHGGPIASTGMPVQGTGAAVRAALREPGYGLLAAGFFVCGFHVAFLATHLPGVIAACGLPVEFGAWSLGILGLFNVVGSIGIGLAMGRWRMKSLLSLLYASRALAVLLFVLAPKTGPVVLVFAAFMGLTFLSTVPPTAGLVVRFFGLSHMATLFGLVMLAHQIGGFLGAWLGGRIFEWTGAYDLVWYIDIVLAVGAALVHLPIREAPVQRAASA
jgi:predicted MFS family arabinose efflux permease